MNWAIGAAHKRMRSVLYIQYADPAAFPPLERSAWQFLDRGWRVRFLGVGLDGDATRLRLATHPNLSVRLLPPASAGGGRSKSILQFYTAALAEIARMRPDVIYCSDDRSCPVGVVASVLPYSATVLHEHDTPLPGGSGDLKVLQAMRRLFARRADLCVIPQDERAASFKLATRANRVIVAYNCPSMKEVGPPPLKQRRSGLVLWHHGSIGPGRIPMTLIDALALVPDDVELRFAGYETVSTRGYVDQMKARAAELGIGDRLIYLGPIPGRDQLYAAASEADVGVSLFTRQFAEPMVGASNKPFDFLACGLPLIVNDTQEWQDFYASEGVAQVCNPAEPEDIARVIRWYREHPEERHRMAEQGYSLIKGRWNYEQCFAPVLRALGADDLQASA